MNRKRRWFRITLILAALLAAVAGGLIYREIHQQDINRALFAAIQHRDTPAVLAALRQGADVNAQFSPPDRRSWWRKGLDALLHRRPPSPTRQTALLLAVQGVRGTGEPPEQAETVKVLLAHGADVNARDEGGTTALMSASVNDHQETIALLLKAGAKIDLKDNNSSVQEIAHGRTFDVPLYGRTALQYAAEFDHPDVMQQLLEAGADVNVRDGYGHTLLMSAAAGENGQQMRLLMRYHTDIDAQGKEGATALMLAANSANIQAVRLLIRADAKVNLRDNEGKTALMYNLESPIESEEVVRTLLDGGTWVNARTNAGETALKLARKSDHARSILLLQKAGAKE